MSIVADLCELVKNDASKAEVIEKAFTDMSKIIKRDCPEAYKKTFMSMHKALYGPHFSKELAEKAVSGLENTDGTTGGHWTLEQTESVRKQYDLKHNAYDWYYTMNMMWADYGKVIGSDTSTYAKMADAYLSDPDAPHDKALSIWVWTHDMD